MGVARRKSLTAEGSTVDLDCIGDLCISILSEESQMGALQVSTYLCSCVSDIWRAETRGLWT